MRYFLALIVTILLSNSAYAADHYWSGAAAGNNLWSTSGNWTQGTVPSSSEIAYIGQNNANKTCEINSSVTAVCKKLIVANWQASNIVLNMSGGSLTVINGPLEIAKWIGTGTDGTVNLSGGSIIIQNGDLEVGNRGDGYLNMTAGTIDISKTLWICNHDGSGTIQLDGGTITAADLDSTMTTGSRSIDITEGRILLKGNKTAKLQGFVNSGWITAFNGTSDPLIMYNTVSDTTHLAGIEIQPYNLFTEYGQNATFTINTNLQNITTYRWYKSLDNANHTPGDDTLIQSGASHSLTIPSADFSDEAFYYCILVDAALQEYSSSIATLVVKRLVALWTMDSDPSSFSGTQYLDTSTEDADPQHANVNGSPVFVPGVNPAVTNEAVLIDVNNGWATAGTWDPSTHTNQFTVSLWAYWNGGASFQNVISKKDGNTAATDRWQLQCSSTEETIFWSAEKGALITESLPENRWAMLTVTFSNGTAALHLDGVEKYSDSLDLADHTEATISIGKWMSQTFNGALDDIRIYNYALSPQEISILYSQVIGNPPCDTAAVLSADVAGPLENHPDCIVDLYDFVRFTSLWLNCGAVYQNNCL